MDAHSNLNMKDLATSIANQMLQESWRITTQVQMKKILAFAKKWGAQIADEQEEQAINDLREFFEQPASWPTIQVNPVTEKISTSAAAPASRGRKPVDSDSEPKASDPNKRKATDFGELKLPDGMTPILCPVEVKSGTRKGQSCDKVCKRVTDAHNPSDPVCAKFECGHFFCGQHIGKAAGMDTSAAKKRLDQASDANSSPVTVNDGENSTTLPPGTLKDLKPETQSAAAKQAVSKIFERVRQRKEATEKANGKEDE